MKHEMTAREYAHHKARMCYDKTCSRCPLKVAAEAKELEWEDCITFQRDHADEDVRIVAEWAVAHPEETLEPLGNNIYFDPKHRIVADEVIRVYTIELTQIGERECERGYLMALGKGIANEFAAKAYPYKVDDAKCVRAQQFITKCHEEEI